MRKARPSFRPPTGPALACLLLLGAGGAAHAQSPADPAPAEIAATAGQILGAALILDVLAATVILAIHIGAAVYLRRRVRELGGPAWAWSVLGLLLGALALAIWFSSRPLIEEAQRRSSSTRDAAPPP